MARVLLSIHSEKIKNKNDQVTNQSSAIQDPNEGFPRKEFLAFVLLSEVNNINCRFKNNLNFRLCIGLCSYIQKMIFLKTLNLFISII